jgi:hypothetical protein
MVEWSTRLLKEAIVSVQDTSEIRELSGAQLDLVTGGSIAGKITTAVKVLGAAATIIYAGAWGATASADYHPDPWG